MSEEHSTSIKQVSSCPSYIDTFIKTNISKLNEIYDEGYNNNQNEGCLGFNCNQSENKMDVVFMNKEYISNMLTSDSWERLKLSIPKNKKLFFVKDEDLNAVFLLYI
jgi:hypothetical protein